VASHSCKPCPAITRVYFWRSPVSWASVPTPISYESLCVRTPAQTLLLIPQYNSFHAGNQRHAGQFRGGRCQCGCVSRISTLSLLRPLQSHRCRCRPYPRPANVGAQRYGAMMTMSIRSLHGRVQLQSRLRIKQPPISQKAPHSLTTHTVPVLQRCGGGRRRGSATRLPGWGRDGQDAGERWTRTRTRKICTA
jgi:hypothetical protein